METIWLACVTAALLAVLWLRWRYKNRRLLELSRQFPGPTPLPVLGNALLFMCKPEGMAVVIQNLLRDYGAWIRFWLGPDLNVIVNDPDDIKEILSSTKMSVKGPQYKYMADIIGGGLLSGSGPTWRRHRKIVTPNYGKRAIETYGNILNDEVTELMTSLRQEPRSHKFDIYKRIVQTTSIGICQMLMGLTRKQTLSLPNLQKLIELSPQLYGIVFYRMTKWWYQIDLVFRLSSYYKQQREFIEILTEFSQAIINHRKNALNSLGERSKMNLIDNEQDPSFNSDLSVIDRLIVSNELSTCELICETFTVFTSSQEASAKISSALILMMAHYPECQERLYEEIKNVFGEKDRDVTDHDVRNMPYLDMVYKETLRLFPIGAMLQRTVTEDFTISKGVLPAGCSLMIPVYHLLRDLRFWDNPDSFDPDRFSPENVQKRQQNCYIPFSLGPMDCLGRYFGTKVVKTICVRFLREYEVTPVGKYEDIKMDIAISASPINGYIINYSPREQ